MLAATLDRLYYAVAAAVLAAGVVQSAYFAAGALTHPNLRIFLACLVFFPVSALVTGAEFLALTRGGRRRIAFAGSLLRVLAIAALLPLIASLPEFGRSMLRGESGWFLAGFAAVSVSLAAIVWAAAWLHNRIANRLPPDAWDLRFSLREAALLCPILGAFLALTLYFGGQTPRFERSASPHAASVFRLPNSARNLTYYREHAAAPPELAFDVPEADFVKWIERREGPASTLPAAVQLQPITTTIRLWQRVDDDDRHSSPITTLNGLVYCWSEDGRELLAAYNRDTQRAYFRCPVR